MARNGIYLARAREQIAQQRAENEREHRRRHLRGEVGVRPAVLHADRVGDVCEHAFLYRPHGHQNSTPERSSSAAICCATYSLVA